MKRVEVEMERSFAVNVREPNTAEEERMHPIYIAGVIFAVALIGFGIENEIVSQLRSRGKAFIAFCSMAGALIACIIASGIVDNYTPTMLAAMIVPSVVGSARRIFAPSRGGRS